MNTPHSEKSECDRRLDELVTAYLKAVEAGEKPNRQEWLARHPDLADELAAFIDAREQVDQLAGSLRAPTPLKDNDDADAPTVGPNEAAPAQGPLDTVRYFGDYELLEQIARGGMGVVYKARQLSLNRTVAIKMILAGQLASPADVHRFRREAESAASLEHPNIVPIFEVGEHQGQHYYSMGYVEGGSLGERLAKGPLPPRVAAGFTKTIASAVQFAHDHGVIHRDLKPANILLDRNGQPRITDFGLAKRLPPTGLRSAGGPTIAGDVLGTPCYMAPEQAEGKINLVGPLADVYSLGAILYALLTGRPPFQAPTPIDTLLQVVEQEPDPPSKLNPQVPHDLETICLKCLEKRMDRRYGSATELADDLGRFLNLEPIRARRASTVRRIWGWGRRRPWVIAATLSMVVLVAFGISFSLWGQLKHKKWETLYFEARTQRLLIDSAASRSDDKTKNELADQAMALLVEAARMRPDSLLYAEALEVLLASGRGGKRLATFRPEEEGLGRCVKGRSINAPSLELSSDGQILLVRGSDRFAVLEVATGRIVRQGDATWATLGPLNLLAVLEDNKRRSTPRVVNLPAGKELSPQDVQAILEDNNNRIGTLRVVSLPAGKELGKIRIPFGGTERMMFSPDGAQLALVRLGQLELWNPSLSKLLLQIKVPPTLGPPYMTGPYPIAYSRDGRFLAAYCSNDVNKGTGLTIWNAATGEEHFTLPFAPHYGLKGFSVSDEGKFISWSGFEAPVDDSQFTLDHFEVRIHDVSTGLAAHLLEPSEPLANKWLQWGLREEGFNYYLFNKDSIPLGFSHDGELLVGAKHGGLDFWKLATGKKVLRLPGEQFAWSCGPTNMVAACRVNLLNRPVRIEDFRDWSASNFTLEIEVWNLEEARQNLPPDLLLCLDATSFNTPREIRPPYLLWLAVILGVAWALESNSLLNRAARTNRRHPDFHFWNGTIGGAAMSLIGAYLLLTLIECPRLTWGWLLVYGSLINLVVTSGAQLLCRTFNAEQKRIFGLEQTSPLPAPKPWITPFFLFAAIVILSFVLLGVALCLGLSFWAGPVLGALAAIWLWWVRRKRRLGID